MRRSGSSCLLRPRDTTMDGGLDNGNNNNSSNGGSDEPRLSVTMISREKLPPYSTERYFMLSEFHLTAHSVRFVSELQDHSDEMTGSTTPETVDTDSTTNTCTTHHTSYNHNHHYTPVEVLPNDNLDHDNPNNVDSPFPPCLIFYVLWRPDMTTSVTNFTSDVILKAVEKIQSHCDIVQSDEDKKRPPRDLSLLTTPLSPSRSLTNIIMESATTTTTESAAAEASSSSSACREHDSVTGSSSLGSAEQDGKTRLYLVVDRVIPFRDTATVANNDNNNEQQEQQRQQPSDDETKEKQRRQFEVEVALAERLARYIASQPQLRSVFQGITVGVANHKRAAPGLDACLDVINFGARDRRKLAHRDTKSHVGLIAMSADDLLGLDEDGETDAAQNILQTRISTEWHGKGNLKSFAHRAQSLWRKEYGLPPHPAEFPLSETNARRVGRRLTRMDEDLQRLDSFPLDLFLNIGAFLLIAYYVWKGIVQEEE